MNMKKVPLDYFERGLARLRGLKKKKKKKAQEICTYILV